MPIVSVPLASTALSGASYNYDTGILDVIFTAGGSYTFENVPPEVFEGLRDSDSPGRYYHQVLKGRY